MNKICFGCGAKLQYTDKSVLGYVPEEKYADSKYCQRCFKLIHYGKLSQASTPKKTEEIIKSVNKNAQNVIFLIDFVNLYDGIIDIYKSIKTNKILVISKCDIIPPNVSFSQIRNYLKVVYKIKEEILFTSNKSNLNTLTKVLNDMEEVYFLGLTNAGKSSLINILLEKYSSKNALLATSYKENTTQDFVRIKLKNLTIIDSPGFVMNNFALDKKTNIDHVIKPITYQNKVNCTYKLDDILNITIKGNTSAIFYFSKNITIKRDYKKMTEGTTFNVKGNSDIVISGLGFIKVTDSSIITLEQDIMKYINIRPSIVGGNYE